MMKLLVKIAVSFAFFLVLLSFVNANRLLEIFARVDYFFLGLSFVVSLVMVSGSCMKWKVILDLKEKLRFTELLKIYFVGYFFSNILPSTVGGDVVRSYYAGRLIENQAYAAVSIFVERFSGVFFLFILVFIAPLFHLELLRHASVYLPAAAGLTLAFITIFVFKAANPFDLPNFVMRLLLSMLRGMSARLELNFLLKAAAVLENVYGKIIGKMERFRNEMQLAVKALRSDREFLYKLIFLTIFFYFFTWVNVYTSFRAFGVHVGFWEICALVPAAMFVAHVPVTVLGNLGYFESVFVFYFLLVGVDGAESLAMGLLLRLKMLTLGGVGFFTYLLYKQNHRPFVDVKQTGEHR
jgi:uncharacterized protein (TIRG00374 family)